MKTFCLLVVALISFISIVAQERKDTIYRFGNDSMLCSVSEDSRKNPDRVFTMVEQPPVFPGGQSVWEKYIAENFKRIPYYKGIVEVWFIVDLDGTTSRFQIIRPSGLSSADRASIINFFKSAGNWYPARQNGFCVRAWNRVEIKNQ